MDRGKVRIWYQSTVYNCVAGEGLGAVAKRQDFVRDTKDEELLTVMIAYDT